MEDLFPGYYRLKDADRDRLWRDALIVLDANILLNLYRYSPSTRDDLLGLLRRLQARLWLPHQVASEFHQNRHAVILEQVEANKSVLSSLEMMLSQIDDPRKHPFLAPALRTKLDAIVTELRAALQSSINALDGFCSADPICEELTQIYAGRVGPPYTTDALEELHQRGEERYRNHIPPGPEDRKKVDLKKFGDFILWMQLLDKAKSTKTPFLLVTDDNKSDWWWRLKDHTFGPRPELKAEIMAISGHPFHMYTCTKFMEYAKKFLDTALKQSAIDEVRKASEAHRAALLALQQEAEALYRNTAASSLAPSQQILDALRQEGAASSLTPSRQILDALRQEAAASSFTHSRQILDALRQEAAASSFTPSRQILDALRQEAAASSFTTFTQDRHATTQPPDALPPQGPHTPPEDPQKTNCIDST